MRWWAAVGRVLPISVLPALILGCEEPELEVAHRVGLGDSGRAVLAAQLEGPQQSHTPRVIAAVPELPPDGYRPMTVVTHSGELGDVVLLVDEDEERFVPIYIGGTEALAIQLRLEARHFPRPLTHDLMDSLARSVGAKVVRAQVDGIDGDTFLGTIVYRRGKELVALDARPSDAIALAVGAGAPVYVNELLIEHIGLTERDLGPDHGRPKKRRSLAL